MQPRHPAAPQPTAAGASLVAAINGGKIDDKVAGTPSAALWRGFDSALARVAMDAAKAWDCSSVDTSAPINQVAVSEGLRIPPYGTGSSGAFWAGPIRRVVQKSLALGDVMA